MGQWQAEVMNTVSVALTSLMEETQVLRAESFVVQDRA